jgi:hypothetical protein
MCPKDVHRVVSFPKKIAGVQVIPHPQSDCDFRELKVDRFVTETIRLDIVFRLMMMDDCPNLFRSADRFFKIACVISATLPFRHSLAIIDIVDDIMN